MYDLNLTCKNNGCNGNVELDSDSYEVFVPNKTTLGIPVLLTTVKGYCEKCNAEHKYTVQGTADVEVIK